MTIPEFYCLKFMETFEMLSVIISPDRMILRRYITPFVIALVVTEPINMLSITNNRPLLILNAKATISHFPILGFNSIFLYWGFCVVIKWNSRFFSLISHILYVQTRRYDIRCMWTLIFYLVSTSEHAEYTIWILTEKITEI